MPTKIALVILQVVTALEDTRQSRHPPAASQLRTKLHVIHVMERLLSKFMLNMIFFSIFRKIWIPSERVAGRLWTVPWAAWHWVIFSLQRSSSRVSMTIATASSGCIILEVRKERPSHVFCVVVWKVGWRENPAIRYVQFLPFVSIPDLFVVS